MNFDFDWSGVPHTDNKYIKYKKNTKTFSQENEKDQKQNEKGKKIFHSQKTIKDYVI